MSWVLLLEVMLCIVVVGMLCLSIREGEANVVSCCGMLCCVKKETQKIKDSDKHGLQVQKCDFQIAYKPISSKMYVICCSAISCCSNSPEVTLLI